MQIHLNYTIVKQRAFVALQVLFEDKQLQQTIFNKHRDEMRSLDEKMNEIRVSFLPDESVACMYVACLHCLSHSRKTPFSTMTAYQVLLHRL